MGISNYGEGVILDAIFNNVSLAKASRFLKLHIGDPGEDGLLNPAVETTRKSITGAASVSGTFTSVNDLIWTGVAATETYTHFSLWDASTAGNCMWVGPLSVTYSAGIGETVTLPTGLLTFTID